MFFGTFIFFQFSHYIAFIRSIVIFTYYDAVPYLLLCFYKTLQKDRIEGSTFAVKNHFHCFSVRILLLINPPADKRIINICQCNDLCGKRDRISLQSVWIAFTVISLMMPSAYLISNLDKFFILEDFHVFQHGGTDHCMFLDDLCLLRCQLACLVQYLVINADFSDIVKRSRCRDHQSV